MDHSWGGDHGKSLPMVVYQAIKQSLCQYVAKESKNHLCRAGMREKCF
jgi:hypothetical protein